MRPLWNKVQPQLAKITQVCAYDRAGFGWSDARPGPQDANQIADELHSLLTQANITGPIVLMGHSIAGVYIRAYASRYPQQLSGLIFVDGSTPLQEERPAFKAVLSKGPSPEMQLLVMKSLSILGMPRIKGQCSSVTPGFEPHVGKLLAEENCHHPLQALDWSWTASVRPRNDSCGSVRIRDSVVL